ncbi:UNVERIFIED_CONTAM: hypothetical protein Sindi_0934700 [Sesamum indicum]
MKDILTQQKVFKAIDDRYTENISEEKQLENDEYVYSSIILNLSDNVLRKVGKQNCLKELWEKLEELYTDTSLPSKLFLLEKLFRYKVDLSRNTDEKLDDFTKLIQDIKLTGDKNIHEYSPIVLLNAIPNTYSDVKVATKYDRDIMNLDTVVNGLKSKEIDLKMNRPSNNQHEVNSVRGVSKFRNSSYRHNSRSKSINRNNNRSKSRTRDNSHRDDKTRDGRCYNCGLKGQYIKDCKKSRRDNRDNNSDEKERVNNVADDSGEVFIVSDVNSVHSMNMHEWLIDSGIGDISLNFNDDRLTLKNVRYVPELSHNLISCAALEEEGLEGIW